MRGAPARPLHLLWGGGLLHPAHSFNPIVIPSVAQCHASVKLLEAFSILGHHSGPLAVFEEGIGLHLLHELIAAHYGLVLMGARKNRASINDSASDGAVDVDDDGGEPSLPIY